LKLCHLLCLISWTPWGYSVELCSTGEGEGGQGKQFFIPLLPSPLSSPESEGVVHCKSSLFLCTVKRSLQKAVHNLNQMHVHLCKTLLNLDNSCRGAEWSRQDYARLREKAFFCEPETLFHRFPLFSKFKTLRRLFPKKLDFETHEI